MNRDVPEVFVCSKCRPQLFKIEFGDGSHSQNNYISVLYAQSALLETHAHSIGCVQRHSGVGFFVAARSKVDLPACLLQSVQLALPERQKALTCFQRNCCQFLVANLTLQLLSYFISTLPPGMWLQIVFNIVVHSTIPLDLVRYRLSDTKRQSS